MKILKSPSKTVLNCSGFNKTILINVNQLGDNSLQSVGQQFS
jgi:hypothetical protein